MILSQSTVRGLRTDLERMIPFLIESKTSFLFNSENVEIIAECGTTLIEAIRDRICAEITIEHTFKNRSLTQLS